MARESFFSHFRKEELKQKKFGLVRNIDLDFHSRNTLFCQTLHESIYNPLTWAVVYISSVMDSIPPTSSSGMLKENI